MTMMRSDNQQPKATLRPPPHYQNSPVIVVGISGASRSGKTRLAQAIQSQAQSENIATRIIGQDEFWTASVALPQQQQSETSNENISYSQEHYDCTDWDGLLNEFQQELQEFRASCTAVGSVGILVAEGFQIFYHEPLRHFMNLMFHLDLDRETCVNRRSDYEDCHNSNPANRVYCETVLWPQHVQYEREIVQPLLLQQTTQQIQESPIIRLLRQPSSPISNIVDEWLPKIMQDVKAVPIWQFHNDYVKLSNNYQAWLDERGTWHGNKHQQQPVVLVSTGSYSPVHRQHVRVFEEAMSRMEAQGFRVLAGFLSPTHDDYVGSKLGRAGGHISSRHRYEMIQLATQHSSWVGAHSWEMGCEEGFVDFGDVLMELRQQIHEWLGNDSVQVRYLCGMDHAIKCGLLDTHFGASLGTVVLARPGSGPKQKTRHLTPQMRNNSNNNRVLVFEDEALLNAESAAASSTQVRDMILQNPTKRIPWLNPEVERYLRANAKTIGGIYSMLSLTAES